MNLEPDRILQPLIEGNNLDTKVVQLRVMNANTPTPKQLAETMKQFALHRMAVRASIVGFQTKDGELTDGSRFRFVSNSGMHEVLLWPAAPGGTSYRLPHGFAVVTNWHKPFIYKFKPADSTWTIATDTLPQLPPAAKVDGYNQIARLEKPVVLPSIHDETPLKLWDFGPHPAPKLADITGGDTTEAHYSVPANLVVPNDSGQPTLKPAATHFLADYVVRDVGKSIVYAMAEPDPVLLTPEKITPLPGCTDATSATAALQLVRKAQTSDTADLWTYRFCNESITRTAVKTYHLNARNVVDVMLPIGANDSVTQDVETYNNMGFATPFSMFVVKFNSAGSATVPLPPFDSGGSAIPSPGNQSINTAQGMDGSSRIYTDLSGAAPGDTSYQRNMTKVGSPTDVVANTVALAAETSVDYPQLQVDVHYPATMYLRGGTRGWNSTYSPAAGERGYSREAVESKRIDARHNVDGTPDARLDVSWTVVHLFQGTTTGRLFGQYSSDTETDYKRGGDLVNYSYAVPDVPNFAQGTTQEQEYDWWQAEPNSISSWVNEWEAWPVPDPQPAPGANNSVQNVTINANTALYCTGSYDLTSRHIIDYDHRSRFYAAIRCEVQCTGARWDQDPSGYQGELIVTSNPSYTVNIYFESNWNGTTASQLLASGTCTRPAFEFPARFVRNVYTYPDSNPATDTINYWMPPEPGLPKEVAESLVNATIHQGVNPNLVARMYYTTPTDPAAPPLPVSPLGIEYTEVQDDGQGNITAKLQKRFVDGQLYARTFKLSDTGISDALWMLHALCVDAPQNNSYPTDGSDPVLWYYLPALGNTVKNTKFHIEVRNGVIEQWSDNIAHDDTAASVPAATDRKIALYEI